MEDREEILRMAALQARSVYCECVRDWEAARGRESEFGSSPVPRYDGGRDASGKLHDTIWPRLATYLVQNGCEISGFIRCQFACANPARRPEPKLMMTSEAMANYARYRAGLADDLKCQLHVEVGNARLGLLKVRHLQKVLGWTEHQAHVSLVMDAALNISPLMRYALACQFNELASAARWLPEAARQYLECPAAYDAVWGEKYINAQLRQQATGIQSALSAEVMVRVEEQWGRILADAAVKPAEGRRLDI